MDLNFHTGWTMTQLVGSGWQDLRFLRLGYLHLHLEVEHWILKHGL